MLCADQAECCSVDSCRCDASLSYSPSQGKIPAVPVISLCWHYLLGVSADAWQNDIPDSSAAQPDNSLRLPHKEENTKSHSANAVSGDTSHLSPPPPPEKHRRANTSRCPENWRKQCKRKGFHISSGVSKCQRSIKVETSQKQYERISSVTEPAAVEHFLYHPDFWVPWQLVCVPRRGGGGEIICPGRQQAEVGGCLETAQAIVLTVAWTDASPSAHNQKDAAISAVQRNQRGRCTFGFAHQQ